MKKLIVLGALFVFTISIAQIPPIGGQKECPDGCSTAAPKCCSTPGGSTYYGML